MENAAGRIKREIDVIQEFEGRMLMMRLSVLDAAKTENIRIGTGGVMMMHYSPLKMAEVFKTLSAFSPGRIDFGDETPEGKTVRLPEAWMLGPYRGSAKGSCRKSCRTSRRCTASMKR